MHVDRAFARLALAWPPKKSVMLVKGPQAGVAEASIERKRVLGYRCTCALAATAATKIKFQLLVDTAPGMTTNGCAARGDR